MSYKDIKLKPEVKEAIDTAINTKFRYKSPEGLNEEVVRYISEEKNEPKWMLEKRLKSLKIFNQLPIPNWGPDLSKLDLNKIIYYATPEAKKNAKSWDDVPEDIKITFQKLGIPEAEQKVLAGAGAQFESQSVYHSLKKEWEDKGVVFLDCDEGLEKYPELYKKYFMTSCVSPRLHKFAALHGAVWSGGTFLHIPKNVKVDFPLQAYFRMNTAKMGQFEHTLIIVEDGAQGHYIEGCFTKGTKITTNSDYKPIEKVKKGDRVLTHTGEYKKVYHTQVRPYTGNLYNIQIFGDSTSNIEVTEEHPLLFVKRERKRDRNKKWDVKWTTPDKLNKRDYLVLPVNKTIKKAQSHEFEIDIYDNKKKSYKKVLKPVPLTKEFFRLIGYYLAEGSISSGFYLNFSFGSHEEEYIKDVENILQKTFGVKSHRTIHKKNSGTSVVVNSVELCRIFKEFGTKCNKKQIPQWLLIEDPEKQKELIIGLFRGNGNYYKKRTKTNNWLKEVFRINTTSEKLARQTREILLRIGIAAFLNKRIREKSRMPIYTVGVTGEFLKSFGDLVGIDVHEKVNNKRRASMFFVDTNYLYVPIKDISKKSVKNIPVYNFSVEGDESYVAEGVAAHNCSAPQYMENSLHAGCVEIFVGKSARFRYSSVENWSKNTYNLNTKRAIVDENGIQEWVGGNLGCLTGDTKIARNPDGPINIKDLQPNDHVIAWNSKINKLEKAKVKGVIYSGDKEVFKVKVAGREIEASANHLFLTLEHVDAPNHKKGFFKQVWKPLSELKKDDFVAIAKTLPDHGEVYKLPQYDYNKIVKSKNQYTQKFEINVKHLFKKIKWPTETNEEFMWFLGILLGDGNIWIDKKSGRAKINIAIPESSDLRNPLKKVIKNLFGYEVKYERDRYIVINSLPLAELFIKIGLGGTASTKKIPKWIHRLPKSQKLAFLAGYFDANGHIGKNGIYFTSINKQILEGIKELALECGLGFSHIFNHGNTGKREIMGVKSNAKQSYRILLNGKKVKEIPTKSNMYKKKITKIKTRRNFSTVKGKNFKSKINEEVGFAKIIEISSEGIKPTYDIEVENYHNFVANGFIVHNSGVTMLYPCTVLKGKNSRADHIAIAFAGKDQNQDTGAKIYHLAPKTTSVVTSKSISVDGGITSYRGLLDIKKGAKDAKTSVQCDALIMGKGSVSNTFPCMKINENKVDIAHEATVGKISEDQIFYLMSRGLSKEQATSMIVSGFIEPVVKELTLEYAVELNRLIQLEMEGSVG